MYLQQHFKHNSEKLLPPYEYDMYNYPKLNKVITIPQNYTVFRKKLVHLIL